MEGGERRPDHPPAAPARRIVRLGKRALHDGRGFSRAVLKVFVDLYDKKLLYRDKGW